LAPVLDDDVAEFVFAIEAALRIDRQLKSMPGKFGEAPTTRQRPARSAPGFLDDIAGRQTVFRHFCGSSQTRIE